VTARRLQAGWARPSSEATGPISPPSCDCASVSRALRGEGWLSPPLAALRLASVSRALRGEGWLSPPLAALRLDVYLTGISIPGRIEARVAGREDWAPMA
jgi:hypothetical protein